jgi:hypothetical protein
LNGAPATMSRGPQLRTFKGASNNFNRTLVLRNWEKS